MTPIKFALIGAGDIVRKRVAPALRDSPACEFVAVARADAAQAASFAAEFGAATFYADWRDMIADPAIEAVYVATPVHLHAEQTIAAAEAGKHVLCEKPMALDVAECDRMIAACRAHGVHLGIAYYRHFYPIVQRMKALIDAGEIGVPAYAQINAFEWFDLPPDHPRAWFLQRELAGGGPMFDFGCHRLEVLTHVFGPVRRVTGMLANVHFIRDVEDTAAALLQFERGVCGVVSVTHAAHEPRDTRRDLRQPRIVSRRQPEQGRPHGSGRATMSASSGIRPRRTFTCRSSKTSWRRRGRPRTWRDGRYRSGDRAPRAGHLHERGGAMIRSRVRGIVLAAAMVACSA